MDKLTEELDRREAGTSQNHMLAYVWDDLFNCYLRIYEDITIVDKYDGVTGL